MRGYLKELIYSTGEQIMLLWFENDINEMIIKGCYKEYQCRTSDFDDDFDEWLWDKYKILAVRVFVEKIEINEIEI